MIQRALASALGASTLLLVVFATFRWLVIAAALLFAFALAYYFGPDVEQRFVFITPGSVLGVILLAVGSLAFRFYVSNFGNYNATYGSLGAVVVLLLWLYLAGWVILTGFRDQRAHRALPAGRQAQGREAGAARPLSRERAPEQPASPAASPDAARAPGQHP